MPFELDLRWQSLDGLGLEHCHVRAGHAGIHVDSVVIGERDGTPFGVRYQVDLGLDWTFESAIFEHVDGRTLELRVTDGHWSTQFGPLPGLAGCVDIDISGTPFTNTLPMRRKRFEIGAPRRFAMAWVPLDTLEPLRDDQVYTRLDATRFRYEAADGSFTQVLTVDENRFVVDYPTLFRRM